jgi:hypothetical protein
MWNLVGGVPPTGDFQQSLGRAAKGKLRAKQHSLKCTPVSRLACAITYCLWCRPAPRSPLANLCAIVAWLARASGRELGI